jgi:hypothetical protein
MTAAGWTPDNTPLLIEEFVSIKPSPTTDGKSDH